VKPLRWASGLLAASARTEAGFNYYERAGRSIVEADDRPSTGEARRRGDRRLLRGDLIFTLAIGASPVLANSESSSGMALAVRRRFIPPSRQDPKIAQLDDAKVVGDLIAKKRLSSRGTFSRRKPRVAPANSGSWHSICQRSGEPDRCWQRPVLISRLSRSMMSQGHVSCTLLDAIGTVLLRICSAPQRAGAQREPFKRCRRTG
jgi:hypothetical protein